MFGNALPFKFGFCLLIGAGEHLPFEQCPEIAKTPSKFLITRRRQPTPKLRVIDKPPQAIVAPDAFAGDCVNCPTADRMVPEFGQAPIIWCKPEQLARRGIADKSVSPPCPKQRKSPELQACLT